MKDLDQEQKRATAGLVSALSAGGLTLFASREGTDPASYLKVGVIVLCLVTAGIFAMQRRILQKAADGRTAQAYLSVGRTKPPPPRWVGVTMVLACLVLVIGLLVLSEFDPNWVLFYAIFGVVVLSGVTVELRRLRAMGKPSTVTPSETRQGA